MIAALEVPVRPKHFFPIFRKEGGNYPSTGRTGIFFMCERIPDLGRRTCTAHAHKISYFSDLENACRGSRERPDFGAETSGALTSAGPVIETFWSSVARKQRALGGNGLLTIQPDIVQEYVTLDGRIEEVWVKAISGFGRCTFWAKSALGVWTA
jgi:hypothetical protein